MIPSLDQLEQRVRRAMNRGLPGFPVQKTMAPRRRDGTVAHRPGGTTGIPAAALALFLARNEVPYLVLTVRSDRLPHHRGQVSLPGGVRDDDESLKEAALRETREEIGVPAQSIRLAGELTSLFIPSGFRLHPQVGFTDLEPVLTPNPSEVSEILEVPVAHLLNPDTVNREIRDLHGEDYEVPYYLVQGHKVWGATAMVLSELLWVLRGKETGG